MRIVVLNHISLDGVMQAPGRADEDTRQGFSKGGWAVARNDEVMGTWLGQHTASSSGALLFGRRSYEDILGSWNSQGENPFAAILNSRQKFVVSHRPDTPLKWSNSTLLHGDIIASLRALKEKQDGDLVIMGSCRLIHSIVPHDLVDVFRLMVHPIILGRGLRLFPDTEPSFDLQLREIKPTTKGVCLATYERLR